MSSKCLSGTVVLLSASWRSPRPLDRSTVLVCSVHSLSLNNPDNRELLKTQKVQPLRSVSHHRITMNNRITRVSQTHPKNWRLTWCEKWREHSEHSTDEFRVKLAWPSSSKKWWAVGQELSYVWFSLDRWTIFCREGECFDTLRYRQRGLHESVFFSGYEAIGSCRHYHPL